MDPPCIKNDILKVIFIDHVTAVPGPLIRQKPQLGPEIVLP